MDEDSTSRRTRARASTVGAAALLVLSFGPSALALSPSAPAAPTASPVRAAITASASATASSSAADVSRGQRAQSPRGAADEGGSTVS